MASGYRTVRHGKLPVSPERNRVWAEPNRSKSVKKVPVIYYLSRNGHLDHPHFIEVSLSSDLGLHLKDVINRLDALRGKGMANLYSWSSKRSYKNGFVWQDLSEEDYIHPAQGNEYILKGSEILNFSSPSYSSTSSSDLEINKHNESELSLIPKKKMSAWNSFDLNEYRVCRSNINTNASTQTEDDRIKAGIEVSPPKSSSTAGSDDQERTVETGSSGRFKASAVFLQLASCVHVAGDESATRGSLEEKEYFSGSAIEVKKKSDGAAVIKRSNSFNVDKNWKKEMNGGKLTDGARAKCIPRRNKGSGKSSQGQKVRD